MHGQEGQKVELEPDNALKMMFRQETVVRKEFYVPLAMFVDLAVKVRN